MSNDIENRPPDDWSSTCRLVNYRRRRERMRQVESLSRAFQRLAMISGGGIVFASVSALMGLGERSVVVFLASTGTALVCCVCLYILSQIGEGRE